MVEHDQFAIVFAQYQDAGEFPDDEDFNIQLELLGEKDELTECLDKSKEFMEQQIGLVENSIRKGTLQDWQIIESRVMVQ